MIQGPLEKYLYITAFIYSLWRKNTSRNLTNLGTSPKTNGEMHNLVMSRIWATAWRQVRTDTAMRWAFSVTSITLLITPGSALGWRPTNRALLTLPQPPQRSRRTPKSLSRPCLQSPHLKLSLPRLPRHRSPSTLWPPLRWRFLHQHPWSYLPQFQRQSLRPNPDSQRMQRLLRP